MEAKSNRGFFLLTFFQVLGYFHQHKKLPEVDKVLHKLYEPIIWRACKVSNFLLISCLTLV